MPRSLAWIARTTLVAFALVSIFATGSRALADDAGQRAAPRLALLIGNAPRDDNETSGRGGGLRPIADQLRRLGFATTIVENAQQPKMGEAIRTFIAAVPAGSTALFLFRGVMLRVGRTNLLMPAGARGLSESEAREAGIDLNTVESDLSTRGAAVKVIVVDASRSDVVARRFNLAAGGPAALELHDGTLAIVNAAQDQGGRPVEHPAAEDDLFLTELLRQTAIANVTLEQAFAKTRIAVATGSGRRQVPSVSSSLLSDFSITQDAPPPVTAASPPPAPSPGAMPKSAEASTADSAEVRSAQGAPPGPGEIFKDCDTCPELVVVPSGEFIMGSTDSEFEKPPHKVTLAKPFAIGRYEVTFAQWDACAAARACRSDVDDHGAGRGQQPVVDVSWDEIQAYLKWLSGQTKQTYRLPSEAEWEYAARGGSRSTFPWGSTAGSGKANCDDCGPSPARATQVVGSFRPNAFGLFDMAGNAAEFVEDCWNGGYKSAPADGAAWRAGQCQLRVLRGGSFASKSKDARTSARFRYDRDVRYYTNGFRVARNLP